MPVMLSPQPSLKVPMRNPKTGEIKGIKVGWSWGLFLFSSFFGLPLFLRKLHVWGAFFLLFFLASMALPEMMPNDEESWIMQAFFFIVECGLMIFIAIKGNEMTAKNYLENDWEFVEPDSELTLMAKAKWGIMV